MTQEILDNIAFSLARLSENELSFDECLDVLKIFNVFYSKGNLTFKGNSRLTASLPQLEQGKWGPKGLFKSKITPCRNLSAYDIQCVEDILNSDEYKSSTPSLSLFLSSLGWELTRKEDRYIISFGSSLLPQMDWKR